MLPITDLSFGFSDAENYRRREEKQLFNNIFIRTDALDRLCSNKTFFLIGEKGTGKTAYALYLANNSYKETTASHKFVRETDYQKFVSLKRDKHLALSDYTNIWKVIIYLLLAKKISERATEAGIFAKAKFKNLIRAIDEYYNNAFSPEIMYALNFIEQSKLSADLLSKYAKLGGEETDTLSFSEQRFQINLMFIQRKFEEALSAAKLKENHLLLIDGIDIRPASIAYEDYSECVKGLANAIWSVNNDFFANIKASKGMLRAVLLVRPDIFDSLGLQNQNNKARDNGVLLDWRTTYTAYRSSALFTLADRLLAAQQPMSLQPGEAWDHYFPFKSTDARAKHSEEGISATEESGGQSSFVAFLRFSFYRPRDIITMMSILREQFQLHGKPRSAVFQQADFDDPDFRRKYADYLMGEIKDHLAFYYSAVHYEDILKFFQYLRGKVRFTYEEYLEAFQEFELYLRETQREPAEFFTSPDTLLQFLFELNIICWIQDTEDAHQPFIHWCFRERTLSNISPKVKNSERYGIHYGLGKIVNAGKRFRRG